MRGFTLPGTALDKPFPTKIEGVGLVNYTAADQQVIEAAQESVVKQATILQGHRAEWDQLMAQEGQVDVKDIEACAAAVNRENAKLVDAEVTLAHRVITLALCNMDGQPFDTLATEQQVRDAGSIVRRRMMFAYNEAVIEVGKSA